MVHVSLLSVPLSLSQHRNITRRTEFVSTNSHPCLIGYVGCIRATSMRSMPWRVSFSLLFASITVRCAGNTSPTPIYETKRLMLPMQYRLHVCLVFYESLFLIYFSRFLFSMYVLYWNYLEPALFSPSSMNVWLYVIFTCRPVHSHENLSSLV